MLLEALRSLLAGVLVVAGLAKLADRAGTVATLEQVGVRRPLRAPLAVAVPLVELGLAAALIPAATAAVAAAATAVLLAGFAGVIAVALARGHTVDCRCFGALHQGRAGRGTVARDAALAGTAGLVAVAPVTAIGWQALAIAGAVAVVGGQTATVLVLLRRYGRALERIDDLEHGRTQDLAAGARGPAFELPAVDRATVTLKDLLARGKPVLLGFVDASCGPCHALMGDAAVWQREHGDQLTVAMLSRSPGEENVGLVDAYGLKYVLTDEDGAVAGRYGVDATPSAVVVAPDGSLAAPPATGTDPIRELVESATGAKTGAAPVAVPVVAAATAGAVALAAAPAQAQASPEMQALGATLRAGGPRIEAAAKTSSDALAAYVASPRRRRSARRRAAARALARERVAVLALHDQLQAVTTNDTAAHNAKTSALIGLSGWAQSVATRRRAVLASKTRARTLAAESEKLFTRSLGSIQASAQKMGSGS